MLNRIASGTLEAFSDREQRLLKAIVAPALLLVAIEALVPWVILSLPINFGLAVFAYSWMAVSIHRAILIPENPATSLGWRVVVYAFAFSCIIFGSAILVLLPLFLLKSMGLPLNYEVGKVVAALLGVIALIWASRFCFVLPAIAIDKKYSLSESSFHTGGNRIWVFLVFFGLPILINVILTLGGRFVDDELGDLIIGRIINVLVTIVGITMLSVLFRELVSDDA